MTMAQLLKRVKALPPRQRDKLMRQILALEEGPRRPARRRTTRVTWPDIEARAKRIAGERVLPNLVLLERGDEAH